MPKNHYAIFFLNTGRCGSQFFAGKLAEHYHDIARVEHEPHKEEYQPPVSFSMLHRGEQLEISPTLREHFESIDETLETRHYVEAGWPSYGMLPYLVERFKGRIKIVHLYRHPAKVAASLTTHNVYDRGAWSEKMSITPEHSGVKQGHLGGDRWKSMDEFCKCLFWWTEINRFALDFKKDDTETPWLALRFEDVFDRGDDDTLRGLCRFLEFPEREAFLESTREKVDRHQLVKDSHFDVRQIEHYPEAIGVMNELGYSLEEINKREINKRYQLPFRKRVKKRLKSVTKRLLKPFRRASS